MRPIHIWAKYAAITLCGLYYKELRHSNKPNIISTEHAAQLNAVTSKLCKKCVRNMKRYGTNR